VPDRARRRSGRAAPRRPAQRTRGVGDRLTEGPAVELVESVNAFEAGQADLLYRGMSFADIAHVTALMEASLIPAASARRLLRALLDLHAALPATLGFDPLFGDTYTNRERVLRQKIGADAGWLGTARARRECSTVGWTLETRERLIEFGLALADLSARLIRQAERNIKSYMPDFTYLQHAQPTALGHYLLTFDYVILRDLSRTTQCLDRTNASAAGCGSVNGSRLALDRRRLAALLGFPRLIMHARDAMWRPDVPCELMSVLVSAFVNLDRLAEELQIWSTEEFGLVELPDRLCRTSVIMPQKKNPYGLAYIRGLTGQLIGAAAGIASTQKTTSGQPDSRIFAYEEVPRSLRRCTKAVRLMGAIVAEATFDRRRMRELAGGFSTATDAAELLMEQSGVDYTTAHRIVGIAVRTLLGDGAAELTYEALRLAAAGEGVRLSSEEATWRTSLLPESIVQSRRGQGAAGESSVRKMIAECRSTTNDARRRLMAERRRHVQSLETLLRTAETRCGNRGSGR
jgi:argininosuccinate lyase